jgi:hypothetical protein
VCAFKTELDLNHAQKTACLLHMGDVHGYTTGDSLAIWNHINKWSMSPPLRPASGHQTVDVTCTCSRAGETKPAVVLEDMNVSGTMHNHHQAQAADVVFHEFKWQLEYEGKLMDALSSWHSASTHPRSVVRGVDLSKTS